MTTEQPTIEELTAQIADMQERLNEQSQFDMDHEKERDRILSAALNGRVMPYKMLVTEFAKWAGLNTTDIEREFNMIITRHR